MLKQLKALGVVLLVGGMLVGCEAPEEIKNIDGAVMVEELLERKDNKLEAKCLEICNMALEQVDYAAGFNNMNMNEHDYAVYAAANAVDAVIAELDRLNIQAKDDKVEEIVGQYMYDKILEEIHANN